jgi:uncharacterized protein (TIGR02217 family)
MTHLSSTLPASVEIGAQRRLNWNTEVVATDSGAEVRNNRWSTPLRTYDVSFPVSKRDDATYLAVLALYAEAQGNLHSFDFTDWADDETVSVRFDGPLTTSGIASHLEHIVEVTLVEVRLGPES